MIRLWCAIVALGTIVAPSREGRAQEAAPLSPIDLVWRVPPGCPDRAEIEADVAALVGSAPPQQRIRVEGVVERLPDGRWSLHLSSGAANEALRSRELTAASCQALATAAATLAAIQVNPRAAIGAAEATTPREEGEEGPAEPKATTDAKPNGAAKTERSTARADSESRGERSVPVAVPTGAHERRRFGAAAFAGGSLGAVGSPAPGVGGALVWAPPAGRIEAYGFWSPSREIGSSGGNAGDFSLFAAGARGCLMWGSGPVAIGPCAGAEVGRITGVGVGPNVFEPTTRHRFWLASSLGGLVTVHEGALGGRLQIDLVAPLTRDRFIVDGSDAVHRPEPVGVRLLAGGEVRFP